MDDMQIIQIRDMIREELATAHAQNNTDTDTNTDEPSLANISDLRKKIFSENSDLSNREFVETALQIRSAIIASGGDDPFLPHGHGVTVSTSTREAAENAAAAFEHCVEIANGNDDYFNAELAKITRDTTPITLRNKNNN